MLNLEIPEWRSRSGSLTPVPGFPFRTGTHPSALPRRRRTLGKDQFIAVLSKVAARMDRRSGRNGGDLNQNFCGIRAWCLGFGRWSLQPKAGIRTATTPTKPSDPPDLLHSLADRGPSQALLASGVLTFLFLFLAGFRMRHLAEVARGDGRLPRARADIDLDAPRT